MGPRQPRGTGRRARRSGRRIRREAGREAAGDDPLREAAAELLARPLVERDGRPCPRLAVAVDAQRGGARRDPRIPREPSRDVVRAEEAPMPDVDELLRGAREALSVTRVFGEPHEQDGVTVIPAASVRGGGGGGGDKEDNGGGGFALMAKPAGAYVIKDGDVRWRPAVDP